MTRKPQEGPNKSKFIRDHLTKNPKAMPAEVQKAWNDAGHAGKLNPTLYYMAKRKVFGNKAPAGRRGRPAGSTSASKAGADDTGYLALEQQLDQLVAHAVDLGDRNLAESLRQARRIASAKLV